jgi:ABC-type multidrug transport system fused ATPase/permease subunit
MYKIYKILEDNQKNSFLILIVLSIILLVLEFLTFFSLQPIIDYFLNNSDSRLFSFFKLINFNLKLSLTNLVFIFISTFLARSFFYTFSNFLRSIFVKKINDSLSKKIFSNYLNQDFDFFINNDSSILISNLINEVDKFAYRVLDGFLIIIAEIFLVIAIIIFLLISYFTGTIFLIITGSLFFICLFSFYKKKFKTIGEQKVLHDAYKIQDLQKSFYVIQNIKLDHLENFFLKRFNFNTEASSVSSFKLNFLSDLNKPLLEILILFLSVFIMFIFYFYIHLSKTELLAMLGLFMIAMFRLLPSCNRILGLSNQLKYYSSSIDIIQEQLSLFTKDVQAVYSKKDFFFQNSIVFRNVSFTYSGNKKKALLDINFEIKKNDIIGIVGDSGSGKSTLLNLITFLLKPSDGSILIDGKEIKNLYKNFQRIVSYVPQKIYLTNESIRENIIFGNDDKKLLNEKYLDEIISRANLKMVISKLSEGKDTLIGERGVKLSGGEQQRIGIARALYKNPKILILDEATSALDKNSEKEIFSTINNLKNKMTIIIVSHQESVINFCQKIFKIENNSLKKIK